MSKIISTEDLLKNFFKFPNEWFHVREVARLLKMNPTTVSKYLNKLSNGGLLIKKEERGHLLFKAKTENYKYKDAKIHYNIESLRNSGLIDYLERELHFPEAIVLFGSYARGENDQNSDIDIFVVSNKKKELDLNQFEKKLMSKIQLFVKNKNEFVKLQKENKNLVNSIINGIILKGFLEVLNDL